MRTLIIEKTVYTIQELKEFDQKAYERAFSKWQEQQCDDSFWHENVLDEFSSILETFGVSNSKIAFSGFWSQGDGASFTGQYNYRKGWKKEILKNYPWVKDTILKYLDNTSLIMKKYFYKLDTLDITRSSWGNYVHDNLMRVEQYYNDPITVSQSDMEEIRDNFRWIAQEIYSSLEKEYDYLNSEEVFLESCECNEYEFDENGSIV